MCAHAYSLIHNQSGENYVNDSIKLLLTLLTSASGIQSKQHTFGADMDSGAS